jgi:hypothetical protein
VADTTSRNVRGYRPVTSWTVADGRGGGAFLAAAGDVAVERGRCCGEARLEPGPDEPRGELTDTVLPAPGAPGSTP